MDIILWILQLLFVPAVSPLCTGIVRKIKARLQNRKGAGIVQPYRDLWKLLHKDEVISEDASWIFRFAPYAVFAVTLVLGAAVPLIAPFLITHPLGDLLVVIYLLALATFLLALSGMDAGSAFGGFGSSREMTVAALTEAGLMFSLLVPALLTHGTNLSVVAGAISTLPFLSYAPMILALGAFLIAMLAETGRFPFDNPATHLELTMIHEAMILEYSGKRLALMEWAASNKFLVFMTLGANVFLPWGLATSMHPAELALAAVLLCAKILGFCVFVAVLESTMAKYRFFRLPDLLFTSFIMSVIAISLSSITL